MIKLSTILQEIQINTLPKNDKQLAIFLNRNKEEVLNLIDYNLDHNLNNEIIFEYWGEEIIDEEDQMGVYIVDNNGNVEIPYTFNLKPTKFENGEGGSDKEGIIKGVKFYYGGFNY